VRLPGLFSPSLKKNLIFDLLNGREEQFMKVSANSTFQFFNMNLLNSILREARSLQLKTLNVSCEPVTAQEVADLFDVELQSNLPIQRYDMKSIFAKEFGGEFGYLYSKTQQLDAITDLRKKYL
jgi:hypothetical protein